MNGIYIAGMEMPKSYMDVRIYADGRVISKSIRSFGEEIATAIPVPPHGRLVDSDALVRSCKDEKGIYFGRDAAIIGEAVESAPTIIPASE